MLDITVMTGNKVFAPDWDLLRAYKAGDIGKQEYTVRYLRRMVQTQLESPDEWDRVLEYPELALACYCKAGQFCHRHLLKELLIERHFELGNDAVDAGELMPE